MIGARGSIISNDVLEVADPPGVVTEMGPVVAPAGTEVRITGPKTLTSAATPLNETAVAVFKFSPLMVTSSPGRPRTGENPVMTGGGVADTVKAVALTALPPDDWTVMGPVVAVAGTVATSELPKNPCENWATTPLNKTLVTNRRFDPDMVTLELMGPLAGVNPEIVGGGDWFTVKKTVDWAVPFGLRT